MTEATRPGGQSGADGASSAGGSQRDIAILCLGSLIFSLSFQLLTTVLPIRALDLGATSLEIGLITGVFAGASLLARPVVGWRLDRGRRLPLVLLGAGIFALSSFGYTFAVTVLALLGLRSLHGLGMATQTTSSQTLVVDLAPPSRRGSVLGLLGATPPLAMALGPAAGAALMLAIGYDTVFLASCGLAALALLISAIVREPSSDRHNQVHPPWRAIHPTVLWPGIALVCLQFGFGAMISFVPLLALERGLQNSGLFFSCYAVAMVFAQFAGGRASDRLSRVAVIVPGMVVASSGMLWIAAASGWMMLPAGAVFGLGLGAAQPALFALGGDLVPASQRGSAMASLGVFLELGIGGGGTVTGALAAFVGLGPSFIVASGVVLVGAATAYAMRAKFAPRLAAS